MLQKHTIVARGFRWCRWVSCIVSHFLAWLAAWFDLFEHSITIALEQPVLHDAVFLELALGVGFGDFDSDATRIS